MAGRIPEAIESFRSAQSELNEAIRLGGSDPTLLDMAGKNLLYLGRAYGDRLDLALEAERRAVAIYRRLMEEHPDEIGWAFQLRLANDEIGQRCLSVGRWQEAIAAFEAARQTLQEQAAKPHVSVSSLVTIQEQLAELDFNLRSAYDNDPLHYVLERRQLTREMYEISERLAALRPLNFNRRIVHAQSAFDEAGYREDEGLGPDLELLRKSERIWEGIHRESPNHDLPRAEPRRRPSQACRCA